MASVLKTSPSFPGRGTTSWLATAWWRVWRGTATRIPSKPCKRIANILQRYGSDRSGLDSVGQKCGRCHGHGGHSRLQKAGHAAGCECGLDGRRQEPARRRACCKLRCSARTARSMPWRRARWSSAEISAGDGGRRRRRLRAKEPSDGGPDRRRGIGGTGNSRRRLSAITIWNCFARGGFYFRARLAAALNDKFTNSSLALDSTTVRVRVPDELEGDPVNFISLLEAVEVDAGHSGAHRHQRTHRHHCGDLAHPHLQLRGVPRQPDHQHRFHARCFATQCLQPDRPDHRHAADRHQGEGRQSQRWSRCPNCPPWKKWPPP